MFKLKLKKKNKKKSDNINKPEYNVIVKKYMTKNVPQVIAEFTATQDKTGEMNLIIKNVDYDFKEEVSIKESNLITDIKYRLDLMKLEKKDQLKTIDEKITSIEERIKSISTLKGYIEEEVKDDKGNTKKEKKKINILDEKETLRKYKVLKYCIENEGEGSHIEINQQGLKQISYLYDDGILKPIFHVCKDDSISLHPNEGANRKRFYSEQYLIDKEFQEDTNGLLGSRLDKLLKFANVILLAILIFGSINLIIGYNEYHKAIDNGFMNDMRSKAQGSAIDCAYYYAEIMKSNGEVLINYNNDMLNKTTPEQRTEEQNYIIGMSSKLLAMDK